MSFKSNAPHGAGAEPVPAGYTGELYAALDLGTNNCRLLIARVGTASPKERATLRVVDSFSRIVRLGEDVSHTKILSEAAMERTLIALHQCKNKLGKYVIHNARYVATEACRQAKNSSSFLERIRHEIGIPIEIISTEEEAGLALRGCASLLKAGMEYAIVFDIGGGSTEFLWVKLAHDKDGITGHTVLDWLSLPHGVMNLSEQFGGNSFIEVYYDELLSKLKTKLEAFDKKNRISAILASQPTQMLSTSGTVTTLAAVHLNLPRYERTRIDGIELPVTDVRAAGKRLVNMRPSERFAHPCIGIERTDFIISGCAIFEAIAGFWTTPSITIADRGVREGIILSFAEP